MVIKFYILNISKITDHVEQWNIFHEPDAKRFVQNCNKHELPATFSVMDISDSYRDRYNGINYTLHGAVSQ